MQRRSLLQAGVLGAGALALDPFFFTRAAAAACSATGSYGPLGAADANGIRLTNGFSSRVVARAGSRVAPTAYVWPNAPDGGATFTLANGGWVYAANSEVASGRGGASSISFNSSGTATGARRILGGTSRNCAGGPTPWGTWLSCEEVDRGFVYECGVTGNNAVRRPRLGRFKHEAAAVDGPRRTVYMTEDEVDGCLYRFRFTRANDLSSGTLQVARVTNGTVTWSTVPDPAASNTRTRYQVSGARTFSGGEGIWYGSDVVHLAAKGENRVWRYHVVQNTLTAVYDQATTCNPVLSGVDNVVVARSGDVFVAEDGGNMQVVILAPEGSVAPFLEVTGQSGSEITGPAFSPDGSRLYLSSQRGGNGNGITYEVRGPFR